MELNQLITIAIIWLASDAIADCVTIALVLAIFATVRNIFRQTH